MVGLLMVLSASSVHELNEEYGSPWYLFQRQAALAGHRVHRPRRDHADRLPRVATAAPLTLAGASGSCCSSCSCPARSRGQRSRRWLGSAACGSSLGAREAGVLLFVADLLARRAHRIDDTRTTLRPVLVVFLGRGRARHAAAEPGHHDRARRRSSSSCCSSRASRSARSALTGVAGGGRRGCSPSSSRYRGPAAAFLDPWTDPLNTGYQTIQSLVGSATAG